MICQVLYLNKMGTAYEGREYTYLSELPLVPYRKVLCPVADGSYKRAIVVKIDLPPETIQPEWADRVKSIEFYDDEENANAD